MPQDLIIGARTGGSSNLLRVNNASRRFSFRDVDGSWKEAANVDYVVFEKPDTASRFLVLELSANRDYSSPATLNSQTDQNGFIYYDGSAWVAFPASGITPAEQGALAAFNFASILQNFNGQIYFRFWWSDGSTTTEKKASIFPAVTIMNSGASTAEEIPEASDAQAGIARAATQDEVDNATAGFIFVTPATLAAKKFAASQINGLAAVATSGDYNDLSNKYELPAASTSVRGGIRIGSNINLTDGDVISVASASAATAGVIQLASAAEVTAGTDSAKAVTPATLKAELDKKANSSDLKTVATSGSYNDLTDKPTIPEIVAASTTQTGIVRLATAEESSGNLDNIAVTPAGLTSVLSGYYTSTEIDSKITAVLTFKGVKAAESDLPSTDNKIGDVWIVSADSSEYVWNGNDWEKFGPTISLDGYLTSEAAAQTYVAKTQLATVAAAGIVQIGQNIEINAGVISVAVASDSKAGVIQLASAAEVTAGTDDSKAVTPATLKVELDKKVNASSLAAVATSGDYNDLSNKYELPAATSSTIGGVKPGGNLTVTADGTLNFTGFTAQSSDGSQLSSEVKVVKAGSGTAFSYASGVLTIGLDSSVTGGLTAVSHDSTLTGQGTSADPLKVNAVTSVAVEANASDDKIPTELAVRKAVDAQKVTKLVLQRGVSDKVLYPKLVFSASADFSSPSEFDFSSSDFARLSAKVFNGTSWVAFPAEGLDAQFDNKEIAIDVAVLLGDAMPQLPFYVKFCWIESNGTASEYKSSVFPAAPSFAPAADVVDEERLLPTGGATGNVLKIDSSGKAIWSEGVDESRLLPTGGGAGKVLGFQDGADRGNSDNVRLLLQNALTDSATGNASPATVTAKGVTLTAENNLEFSGNDSHVTAVLPVAEIFAADKEWTVDFWFNPVANSSKWNYVLTETNGSWGSHSLGLTWNSTDQTLEQDSGGYVASTIKAPNWPNASTPCASNQWHFVAVEKQKTESGWSLNYYLNGSPWLQVAFTSDFTPFDSTTPFWFGGNTSDGGRWFKGKANKLRVTAGARYGGKAFAVPDRSVNYEAPSGLPVWIDQVIPEPVDESRLLPENPANGDIPCYSNEPPVGVNYNDADTIYYINASNGDTTNKANATDISGFVVTPSGFPEVTDDSWVIPRLDQVALNITDSGYLTNTNENGFTIDFYLKTTNFESTDRKENTLIYDGGFIYLANYQLNQAGKGYIWFYNDGDRSTIFDNGVPQLISVDAWKDESGLWNAGVYVNGELRRILSNTSRLTEVTRLFGVDNWSNYIDDVTVYYVRISKVARYKGQSFESPGSAGYVEPPAGYWSSVKKSAFVTNESDRLLMQPATGNVNKIPIIGASNTWTYEVLDDLVDAIVDPKLPVTRDDIEITASSLSNNKYTITDCVTGHYVILDSGLNQVLVDAKQVGTDVELDFTNWTLEGTYTIKFITGIMNSDSKTYIHELLDASNIKPANDSIYKYELSNLDVIDINTSALSATKCVTFELWLVMGATVVSFTMPHTVTWLNTPVFATANTLYAITMRWDGTGLIANLAYQIPVTE